MTKEQTQFIANGAIDNLQIDGAGVNNFNLTNGDKIK